MNEEVIQEALYAENSVERLEQLLAQDLNPTEHFGYAGTALSMAVESANVEAVKLLLAHGADPNQATAPWHRPALWTAVRTEKETMIQLLLTYGAEMQRSGALHQAAAQLSPSILQLLLQNGANPLELEDMDGFPRPDNRSLTALHRAVRPQVNVQRQVERLDKAPHLETIRLLLNHGVDPNMKTESALTALDIARNNGNFPQVVALLETWDKPPTRC